MYPTLFWSDHSGNQGERDIHQTALPEARRCARQPGHFTLPHAAGRFRQ